MPTSRSGSTPCWPRESRPSRRATDPVRGSSCKELNCESVSPLHTPTLTAPGWGLLPHEKGLCNWVLTKTGLISQHNRTNPRHKFAKAYSPLCTSEFVRLKMLANNSTAGRSPSSSLASHLKISSVEVAFVAAIFSSQLRSQSQAKSSPGYSHLSSGSIKKSLVSNLLRLKDQPLRSPLFSKDYRNMINFRSNGTLLSVLWVMAITAGLPWELLYSVGMDLERAA
ncbi:hypothetical protein H4Q26_012154 [Puccinia striiformis f. sp. tritici PST-130]|nr:hypothetical protein H4Q26_012154 [Puccinia striiformis f. sp. tritici PST-130]